MSTDAFAIDRKLSHLIQIQRPLPDNGGPANANAIQDRTSAILYCGNSGCLKLQINVAGSAYIYARYTHI
jgi:hypothetical protein